MPRLSRVQEEARQRIGRLATSGLPPARLAPALLAAVRLAVPADVAGMGGVEPATLLADGEHRWLVKADGTVSASLRRTR